MCLPFALLHFEQYFGVNSHGKNPLLCCNPFAITNRLFFSVICVADVFALLHRALNYLASLSMEIPRHAINH